ncbi:efflux RND transporter periplasmic adaptor subunit [Gemmatimonadota bacterium]
MPKRRKKSKRWVVLIILILVVIVGANLVGGNSDYVVPVEPQPVERGNVVRRLAESGTIEMDRTVEIKSQVAGRIMRLFADVGDSVLTGELLAVIEPDPNKALQLSGKRASVTLAEMELTEQRRLLEQKRRNHADGIVAQEEIARSEYLFVLAENRLSQQRLELQILEREVRAQARAVQAVQDSFLLQDYEIVSPMDGIITERAVEEGELVISAVTTNMGTIICKVGDPNRLIVKVQISEIDIGDSRAGLEAEITVDALPGRVFPGSLRRVAPTGGISQGSSVVSFEAEVEIIGSFRELRHGMTADVDIIIGRVEDTLYLPIEAVAEIFKLDEDGEETDVVERRVVYVKEGEIWVEKEVTTGLESTTRIEILEGLQEDEEVHSDALAEWERQSGRGGGTGPDDGPVRIRVG